MSTKQKKGLNGILRKIKGLTNKKEISICVLGASNVGKSSILNELIGSNKLTVSKFSGTTKQSINTTIKYKDIKIKFIDTPGLIPNGRISDLLNNKKSVKLVPSKEISRKTFKLNENQYFMLSNLLYFKVNNKVEIQVFASKNIQFHITKEEKIEKLLNSDFFTLLNEEERNEYFKNEFVTENIFVENGNDLVISGLGFIEVKNNDLDIEITYPKKASLIIRESISKLKRISEKEEDIW